MILNQNFIIFFLFFMKKAGQVSPFSVKMFHMKQKYFKKLKKWKMFHMKQSKK